MLGLAGCDSASSQIVGKWKVAGDSSDVIWDFGRDGKVFAGDIEGRYTFGDRGRIKIQTPRATFVHQLQFVGGHMIWTDPDGRRTELVRVP